MSKILNAAALALLVSGFSAGVSAQASGAPDKIVLEGKTGSVMTSTGSDYLTARVGKQLAIGESLMVDDKSKATVAYYWLDGAGEVKRKCVEQYVGANTYVIDNRCEEMLGVAIAGPTGISGILGAGLLGGAILKGEDNSPPAPLSAGPNGN